LFSLSFAAWCGTEDVNGGESKGEDEAQPESWEESPIFTEAELHDVPEGAEIHGKARISALFP
jgi:hypothetical protein